MSRRISAPNFFSILSFINEYHSHYCQIVTIYYRYYQK